MRILITGATGYIGGRLIPEALERGHRVRVLCRSAACISGRPWADRVEVFTGDLLAPRTIEGLCDGVDAACYFVHSMSAGVDFAARDRLAAENYVRAARAVPLTLYLGGLVPRGRRISAHLKSRAEVGAVLRESLPTTEIRSGPVVGSGSASFEMVRYITERHPVIFVPKCAGNTVQPIALRDVLACLLRAIEREALGVLDVGGERLSFACMLLQYAAVRGLSRRIVVLPAVTPRMVALWTAMVTPVPYRIAAPLLQGMLQPVVADIRRIAECFPGFHPLSYRCAVELALARIEEGRVETRWSGALGNGSTDSRGPR